MLLRIRSYPTQVDSRLRGFRVVAIQAEISCERRKLCIGQERQILHWFLLFLRSVFHHFHILRRCTSLFDNGYFDRF